MKPHGYWNDVNHIILELKKIVNEKKSLPSYQNLPSALKTAIKKSKLGIRYYQNILNEKQKIMPSGYWQDSNNLKKEIIAIIENNNQLFPTLSTIEACLGSGGKKAVLQNGGIYNLAKKLGYEYNKTHNPKGGILTSDGHYVLSNYELLFDEFLYSRQIPHQTNMLISDDSKYRFDFKIDNTYIEIWGYEKDRKQTRCIEYNQRRKKKEFFYKEKSLNLISIECSDLKKPISEVIEFFTKISHQHGWNTKEVFPINLDNYFKYCCWTEDRIIHELKQVIKQLNHFPTGRELKDIDKGGLLDAANRKGGLIKFANQLGFSKPPKRRNYWTIQTVTKELKELTTFPQNYYQLKKLGKQILYPYIKKYGGLQYFKEITLP